MVDLSAVGGPYSLGGQSTAWDLKPVLAFACSLILLRTFVGIRISWAIVAACLLAGTIFSTLTDAWGVLPATSLFLTIALLLRVVVQRHRPRMTGKGS
jgi:hypothetical protein